MTFIKFLFFIIFFSLLNFFGNKSNLLIPIRFKNDSLDFFILKSYAFVKKIQWINMEISLLCFQFWHKVISLTFKI